MKRERSNCFYVNDTIFGRTHRIRQFGTRAIAQTATKTDLANKISYLMCNGVKKC